MNRPNYYENMVVESSVAAVGLPQNSLIDAITDRWRAFKERHRAVQGAIGEACEEGLGLDKSYPWQNAKEVWKDVSQPLRADYKKGRRILTGASVGSLAMAQAVGGLRLPMLLAPALALKIGESQPYAAGMMTGTILATWNCISAEVLRNAMSRHPNVVKQVGQNTSTAVDFCQKSLPGLATAQQAEKNSDNRIIRGGKKITNHLRLGFTAISIGVNPSVATAQLSGRKKPEVRKIYRRSSMASGTVAGLMLSGLATAPEFIQNGAKNPLCLIGAGVLLVTAPQAKSRLSDRRYKKNLDRELAAKYRRIEASLEL